MSVGHCMVRTGPSRSAGSLEMWSDKLSHWQGQLGSLAVPCQPGHSGSHVPSVPFTVGFWVGLGPRGLCVNLDGGSEEQTFLFGGSRGCLW